MAKPTFVSETEMSAWDGTSPKTTASISIQAGDIIVAISVAEDEGAAVAISNSGAALTWDDTGSHADTSGNFPDVEIWTATGDSTRSLTVTLTRTGTEWFGGTVLVFRNSDGVGNRAVTGNGSGGPSRAITTTQDNSAIVVASGDWNAVDGTTRTWRTANVTPTAGNGMEVVYFRDSSHYAAYAAYYDDAGSAGAKTVGLSAPVGQAYGIVAVEIKGSAGGGGETITMDKWSNRSFELIARRLIGMVPSGTISIKT